jgi:hypothetical protein
MSAASLAAYEQMKRADPLLREAATIFTMMVERPAARNEARQLGQALAAAIVMQERAGGAQLGRGDLALLLLEQLGVDRDWLDVAIWDINRCGARRAAN